MLYGLAAIVTLVAHPGAGIAVDDSWVICLALGPGYRIGRLAPEAAAPTVLVQGVANLARYLEQVRAGKQPEHVA